MAEPIPKPPETERKIGRTTYTVTSHFKPQGSTASQIIKRLIDRGSKLSSSKSLKQGIAICAG